MEKILNKDNYCLCMMILQFVALYHAVCKLAKVVCWILAENYRSIFSSTELQWK